MDAWDEPAETLLKLAPQQGVQLLMPQLGQPVEPVRMDSVTPWWRGVDQADALPPEAQSCPKTLMWAAD
jgi:hypothetical protein